MMDDALIIKLFFDRDESAVSECKNKYGRYCRHIALRIVNDEQTAKEVENDTYLKAWNSIPPNKPSSLASYIAAICRRTAIDVVKAKTTKKRKGGEYVIALDELNECIPDSNGEELPDSISLRDSLNAFLGTLPERTRVIFMRRYWWMNNVKEIADDMGMTESNVKMILLRTRADLRKHLENEGIEL